MRRALLAAVLLLALAAGPSSARADTKPLVKNTWVTGVGTASANLRAEIDPGGRATTYLFEYTTEANFRVKGFVGATKIPQVGVSIGTGAVFQHVSGLEAATAYRFRAVAVNDLGTTPGPARSLGTDELSPVFSLPDDRGWEMVSPADKNGGEIQGFGASLGGAVIQAAAQGSALTYTSASSFASPKGSPGPGQYVSRRAGAGWGTENVTLPMLSGSYPEAPGSGVPYQLFSSDLSAALVSNGRRCRTSLATGCPVENPPLAGSGAPAGYRNYYLRNGATGTYKALLSSTDIASLPLGPEDFEVAFAGATPGLAHIVISTCAKLTPDASEVPGTEGECDPAAQNLYEKSGSELRLINTAPGATLAAQSRAISDNGARVYFSAAGNLYLRDGAVLKQADAAQGGGGTFQTASLDGSLAFFTKEGHLYRYAAATGTATDLTPGGEVLGVAGTSGDGLYVYYLTPAGLLLNRNATTFTVTPQLSGQSTPPAASGVRISADGHRIVFVSAAAELTAYDNRNINTGTPEPEVYLYAAPGTASAGMTCVSCNPSGERPTGPSGIPGASPNGSGPFAPLTYKPRVLSADTRHVFFDSFDPLAVQDTNGDRDAYEWEAAGTGHCTRPAGCTSLISSGRSEGGATFLDASEDASDVFFLTDGSLVASDSGVRDVYDARTGGGYPASTPLIPCFGDACQPLPASPQDPLPGTLRTKPSGNETQRPVKALHCRKGQVKKRGRCVKRKTRHANKKQGGHK